MAIASYPLSGRRAVLKEPNSKPGLTQSLNATMVLFNPVVEILDRSEFAEFGIFTQRFLFFKLINGWRIGHLFVHVDHPGRLGMTRLQSFFEKAFSRFDIALGTEHEVHSLTVRVHRFIQIFHWPRTLMYASSTCQESFVERR